MENSVEQDLPPQDLHAEQATLGAMLVESGATNRGLAAVNADDFYREAHCTIFKAIAAVQERNEPVDIVTVTTELRSMEKLEAVGGPGYLSALIRETPTAAHVVRYGKIVGEKAALRRLIGAGAELHQMAYANAPDVEGTLHRAEMLVSDIRRGWQGVTAVSGGPVSELVDREGGKMLEQWEHPPSLSGPRLGIPPIDEGLLCGLPVPGLVTIMAQTSHGKTALACQSALLSAMHGVETVYLDLETSQQFILRKMIQQLTGIDAHWRKRPGDGATPEQLALAAEKLEFIRGLPLHIEAIYNPNFAHVRARMLELHREKPRAYFILDFLQKIKREGIRSRYDALGQTADDLQSFVRELDTTLLVGSQVSLDELGRYKAWGVGALSFNASVEILIRKILRGKSEEDTAPPDEQRRERDFPLAYIVINKHREGALGREPVYWDPSWQRFFSLREAGQHVVDIDEHRNAFEDKHWRQIEAGKSDTQPAPWTGLQRD